MRFARPFLILAVLSLAAVARSAEPATLTLEQALASVEKVNLSVLLSREAAVQALEQSRVTRSNALPNIGASANQRRSKGVNIVGGVATPGSPSSRFDAQLTGSVALFDPAAWVATRAARVGVEVARAEYNFVVQNVMSDVASIYFAHLRNLRRLDVLDNNIVRARSLLDLARNTLTAGAATQIDVTRADSQLAVTEQARLQQVTTLLESELALKRAIDLPMSQPLRLEEFNMQRGDTTVLAFAADKTTFEKRADFLRAQKALEQAQLDARAVKFQRLPSLDLTGQYGLGARRFDEHSEETWSTGLGLSMPIFDGFRIDSQRRSALSRQRAQELRLKNLELVISSELRLAAQDASSRNAQVAVAQKGLQLSEEELRLAETRYRQGVADNREVVDAQNRRAIAADNFVEAVFQYNLSRVELARARGDVRSVLNERAP